MSHRRSITMLGGALLSALPLGAQQHEHVSPYADLQDREIKALSEADVEALLTGEGMGTALPAELHGYPGPRHVLDLGSELALTEAQRSAVEAVFQAMRDRAVELGRQIVELERELDALFAARTITPQELDRLVGAIGSRRAELRTVHLRAHLELEPILTHEQRARYAHLRGYEHHRTPG
ncbi:MAG: Spy/CpxP family protein refolding chaperone [Gemmatimonadota bacterium]|nr:Spy/CpxP family protein refolding chaperone [Gemmatimonadota bacterium]